MERVLRLIRKFATMYDVSLAKLKKEDNLDMIFYYCEAYGTVLAELDHDSANADEANELQQKLEGISKKIVSINAG